MNKGGFNLEVAYSVADDVKEFLEEDFEGSFKEIDDNSWLFEEASDLEEALETLLEAGIIRKADIVSSDI